jgi:DUF1365 family protein
MRRRTRLSCTLRFLLSRDEPPARSPLVWPHHPHADDPIPAQFRASHRHAGDRHRPSGRSGQAFPPILGGTRQRHISLWFGYGPDGECRGVIYEVHNTFGETHAYVSAFYPVGQRTLGDKEFHVSPFWSVEGQYRFTLRHRGDGLALIVENLAAGGRLHVASLNARAQPLTSRAIGQWLLAMPLTGIGVMIAIYWQALRLWLKGARYHGKPPQRARRTTLARPEANLSKEEWLAEEDLRKRA